MLNIEWDNKFSVNIKKIDNQHKQIIDILNKIADSRIQDSPKVIEKILEDLINYIRHHFSTEEEYLLKHQYPYFQEHKSQHEKFINKICEFQRDYLITKSLPMIKLFNYVWDWFARHILVTDKKYQAYFDQKT